MELCAGPGGSSGERWLLCVSISVNVMENQGAGLLLRDQCHWSVRQSESQAGPGYEKAVPVFRMK